MDTTFITRKLSKEDVEKRKARALEAMEKGFYSVKMVSGSPDLWQVNHHKDRSRSYTVNEKTRECSCEDFAQNQVVCKHWFMVKYHIHQIDKLWAEMLSEAKTQETHTRTFPRVNFWGLYLESSLTPAEIKQQLGDLADKVTLSENRIPGYHLLNYEFPVKVQARKADITDSEKALILQRLEVA